MGFKPQMMDNVQNISQITDRRIIQNQPITMKTHYFITGENMSDCNSFLNL